jgi:hypothetical protein
MSGVSCHTGTGWAATDAAGELDPYRLYALADFGFYAKRPMISHEARQRIILKKSFPQAVV